MRACRPLFLGGLVRGYIVGKYEMSGIYLGRFFFGCHIFLMSIKTNIYMHACSIIIHAQNNFPYIDFSDVLHSLSTSQSASSRSDSYNKK